MKYIVTIEEMVSQDFEVNADNSKLALEIAEKKYKNGEFVLEPGNLICKQICTVGSDGTDAVEWYEF